MNKIFENVRGFLDFVEFNFRFDIGLLEGWDDLYNKNNVSNFSVYVFVIKK